MLPDFELNAPATVRLQFQWAPTLGGECYRVFMELLLEAHGPFQWAPTLGGECYRVPQVSDTPLSLSFNGHPPLGVNATLNFRQSESLAQEFQWAPTLGGECYYGSL